MERMGCDLKQMCAVLGSLGSRIIQSVPLSLTRATLSSRREHHPGLFQPPLGFLTLPEAMRQAGGQQNEPHTPACLDLPSCIGAVWP